MEQALVQVSRMSIGCRISSLWQNVKDISSASDTTDRTEELLTLLAEHNGRSGIPVKAGLDDSSLKVAL